MSQVTQETRMLLLPLKVIELGVWNKEKTTPKEEASFHSKLDPILPYPPQKKINSMFGVFFDNAIVFFLD